MRCLANLASLGIFCLAMSAGAENLVMRVVSVIGEVKADDAALHPGDSIRFGQHIELGPNGALKVLTVLDRSIFDFTENASVVVAKADQVEMAGRLQLARGRAHWAVHPKMLWALDAQGLRYELRSTVGALSVTSQDGQAKQIAATREGKVEIKSGQHKLTTLSEIDRVVFEGKLDGENLPSGVRPKRELVGGVMVRDWIAASSVEDPIFRQSVQLGAGETARARRITFQFLVPPEDVAAQKRAPSVYDDADHPFSARTSLFELNGSAMQAIRQTQLSP